MPKKRGHKSIPLKPYLHIYCEGEKTEPNYIRSYIETRFPGTRLSPVRSTRKNTPVQLVEEAINAKKMNKQTKAGADRSWHEPYQWNPYTDVYKLLDAIDTFGAQEE